MQCHACDIQLDTDDNYCRKCGAPVRVLDVSAVEQRTDMVKVGPSAPAILATAARPIAAGAAAVAAGALMKFAMRQGVRALIGGGRPRPARETRPVVPAEPQPPARPTIQVTEVLWYRRVTRS